MEGIAQVAVPLRVGKKMRKRRELDALVSGGGLARSSRLLSVSSDEGEPWPRRARPRRHARPLARLCAALLGCICVVATATVLWLFVDVRRQIVSLRQEMDRVSTSSEGVNDALQHCHSAAKELRANTSALSERLAELTNEHRALADRLSGTAAALAAVEEKLAGMPDLTNAPVRLEDLVKMVGDLGSRLSGMEVAVKGAHDTANSAKEGLDEVRKAVENLGAAANASAIERGAATERLKKLGAGIEALNDTVVARLNATEERLKQYEIQLSSLMHPPTAASPAKSLPSLNTQKPPQITPLPVDNATAPAPPSLLTTASTTTTTTQAGVPTKPKIVEARP